DGTIGPVDGLADQVLGAIARGKTRIGYPAGTRRARAQAGKDVDLVELAKARHVDLVGIRDIYDAYRLLTGTQLPAPVPVPEADMALDRDALHDLDADSRAWQ